MSTSSACFSLFKHCKTFTHLLQVHAFAAKTGLQSHPLVAGQLLLHSAVTLSDTLHYALRFFSSIPSPDPFMFNTLIRGFSESQHPHQSLLTYAQMQRTSVPPDSFSFAFLLKAAANSRSLLSGAQVHSHVVHHGFDEHLFVGTTLVSMYAECGCPHSARQVFDEMSQPNLVAWNAAVTACFRSENVRDAEELFARMPWKNSTSWNVMLAGYTKAGELVSARRLFLDMPFKDPVSWSTMIVGFASNGDFDGAFWFYKEMLSEGLGPNEVSLTGMLSACAQAGAFESGKALHGNAVKSGMICIVSVANALLDMYARCGNVDMAHRVFDREMTKKSVISWTSMMAAFAMYGHGDEAIKLFCEMDECGIKPDGITFISLLYACSHAGLVERGNEYFHQMEDKYGIELSIEHYGCMVDLYGRAGLLEEAYEFVMKMPIKPNAIIWRTLLGACSIHGNLGLAEQAKTRLAELDPNDSGDYVLLSNIYAVAGKWKDVANVRRSMSDRRLIKNPGWSSIEVDKIIYTFVASDISSGVKQEAHNKLSEIMLRLRLEGYIAAVSNVLHDIEDEEKHDAISKHSEKLAVAFGIARTSNGSAIRIVKNLRVCGDCHAVMKMISKVYGREIVVRDRSIFHSFKDGSCSCKDYW
ncbi:TPR-like protein [Dioscorea alata]|uniref:TPR-like protein n=1 Tax=Dioscorea alata TaxID=55571 RepID=A0ACB7TWZ9_DIOAL|nr:TPR-like protein [Dioscorea alata]